MIEVISTPKLRLAIVTPVHNDWPSFLRLLVDIESALAIECAIDVFAVDDGSFESIPTDTNPDGVVRTSVRIVELSANLGHQRAIAVGLTEASKLDLDCVVVMDADGEDRPEDILKLLSAYRSQPDKIIVAQRAKRSESFSFRLFYFLYKWTFYLCTGNSISHGNFSLIPAHKLKGLLHISYTWNNLAASIARSRLQYLGVPTIRGRRYEGRSKMNFISLLLHGLSAVSVYLDVLTARILTFCFVALGLVAVLSILILGIWLFTELAIPGWTTNALGITAIIMLQIIVLTANTLFSHLNSRGQPSVVPALAASSYINNVFALKQAGLAQSQDANYSFTQTVSKYSI